MNIISYSFIFIFLPSVLIGYFLLNSKEKYTAGKALLTAASLFFYCLLGIKGFVALSISMLICYCISQFVFANQTSDIVKKVFLIVGIALNILALLYCKYLIYFELLLNKYTSSNLTYTAIVVPMGISYFTFSQIAYLVDTYKDNSIKYSLLDYVLFVSFFPKITVGPISLSTEMIPQFNDLLRKKVDYSNLTKGFYRITLGLAKKLLLADNLASIVDFGYLNIATLGTTNAILVILSYTLQIYFDFSGYCDVAVGIAQMMNMDIIDNFDAPYRSLSIVEFWKRWHISLTRFFTRYLYIPLGGSRKGKLRTYVNTMIVFLVSGLWHGSATTFVVWGAIHGVGDIISKIISPYTKKIPSFIRWFVTFTFVNIAWVFFRAPDMASAIMLLKQLFTGGFVPIDISIAANCIPVEGQLLQKIILTCNPSLIYYSGCAINIILITIALLICTRAKTAAEQVKNFTLTKGRMAFTVLLFVWSVLSLSQVTEFIYVNF